MKTIKNWMKWICSWFKRRPIKAQTIEGNPSINIPYTLYNTLTPEQMNYYEFLMQYGVIDGEKLQEQDYLSDTPIMDMSFEFIKDCMTMVSKGDTIGIVAKFFSLPQYATKLEDNSLPAWKVILTIRYLVNKIVSCIEMENTMLVNKTPSPYMFQIEQVDFSMFTQEYIQLNELADGDITKFDSIRNMKYSDCFVQLLYRQKQSDLQQLIESSYKKQ